MPDNEIQAHLRKAIRELGEATLKLDREYERMGTDNRVASLVIQGIRSMLENLKARLG